MIEEFQAELSDKVFRVKLTGRKEDADSQRYNTIIGVKIVTLIEGFSTIRSKIFYSVLDEKAYLNLAVSF